jgi:hypothetical protein
MLIEQAFFYLPEILVGGGYPFQQHEGGLVTAFSMALLQSLNARNAPNPLSLVASERRYQADGFAPAGDKKRQRYPRADLHLDAGRLKIGTSNLALFGWRHSNWLEAKFFRKPENGTIPTTSLAGELISDFYRILGLVPLECPAGSKVNNADGSVSYSRLFAGRFILHVYQGAPAKFIGEARPYLERITSSGVIKDVGIDISAEPVTGSFLKQVGPKLRDVKIKVTLNNLRLEAAFEENNSTKTLFTCVLSRVEAFKLSWGARELEVFADRTAKEKADGDFAAIRRHLGMHMSVGGYESKKEATAVAALPQAAAAANPPVLVQAT